MFVQHQHPDQWPVCACTCPCTTKNLHLQQPCLPACTTSTCKRPPSEAARTNVCRLCLKSIHHSQALLRCYSSGANSSGANSGDTSFSMFANWSGCSVTWTTFIQLRGHLRTRQGRPRRFREDGRVVFAQGDSTGQPCSSLYRSAARGARRRAARGGDSKVQTQQEVLPLCFPSRHHSHVPFSFSWLTSTSKMHKSTIISRLSEAHRRALGNAIEVFDFQFAPDELGCPWQSTRFFAKWLTANLPSQASLCSWCE